MGAVFVSMCKSFFLITALIVAVAGCGSSGPEVNNGTGSIAAKLTWPENGAQQKAATTAKTLYKAPEGVTTIRISVYSDVSMANIITFKDFTAIPGVDGSGTIDGIPAGNGRAVKVEGLGSHGSAAGLYLTYLGSATVNVVAGPTPTPVAITMEAPFTSVSPVTAPSAAGFTATLTTSVPATIFYTSNEPATIYYTTNGSDPTTGSLHGTSPVHLGIEPDATVTIKFFAVVRGLYEAVRTVIYR